MKCTITKCLKSTSLLRAFYVTLERPAATELTVDEDTGRYVTIEIPAKTTFKFSAIDLSAYVGKEVYVKFTKVQDSDLWLITEVKEVE